MTLHTRLQTCIGWAALALAAILHPNTAQGQDNKNGQASAETRERPKEANVEAIVGAIDPEVRARIVEQLQTEIDGMLERLKTEQESLKTLEKKLAEQRTKVRRADLTLGFLKDRLAQWSAKSGSPSKAASKSDSESQTGSEEKPDPEAKPDSSSDSKPKP